MRSRPRRWSRRSLRFPRSRKQKPNPAKLQKPRKFPRSCSDPQAFAQCRTLLAPSRVIPKPGHALTLKSDQEQLRRQLPPKLRRKMIRSALSQIIDRIKTHSVRQAITDSSSKPQQARPRGVGRGSTRSGGFFSAGLFCSADVLHVLAAFRVQRTDHFLGQEENLLWVFFLSNQGGNFPPVAGRFHIHLRHEKLSLRWNCLLS